jgi:hypothetical protein
MGSNLVYNPVSGNLWTKGGNLLDALTDDCNIGIDCTSLCNGGTTPAKFQMTTSGITNGVCGGSCSAANATVILPQVGGSPCDWEYFIPAPAGGGSGSVDWTITFRATAPQITATLNVDCGVFLGSLFWVWDLTVAGPINCNVAQTLNYNAGSSFITSGSCVGVAPLTMVITPV